MVPTKDRNQSGILIDCGAEKILVDCGEGTQRQLRVAGIAPPKITRIFISHWHGDHVLGLAGLLENLAKNSFIKKVAIYGTKEVQLKVNQLLRTFNLDKKIHVDFTVIKKSGIFLRTKHHEYSAAFLLHSVPCLGFSVKEKDTLVIDKKQLKKYKLPNGPIIGKLKEKKNITYKGKSISWKKVTTPKRGKKVSVVLDTGMCPRAIKLADDSDIFICESTYLAEKQANAKQYKHLTSTDAGTIAKKAKAHHLVITHFSQRYDEAALKQMQREAKKVFGKKVTCAHDFLTISA